MSWAEQQAVRSAQRSKIARKFARTYPPGEHQVAVGRIKRLDGSRRDMSHLDHEARVRAIQSSVEREGIKEPIQVDNYKPISGDRRVHATFAAGGHRLEAARRAGITHVPVRVQGEVAKRRVMVNAFGIEHHVEVSKKRLTTKERNALPDSDFADPKDRRFPMEDKAHAKNALARANQGFAGKKLKGKIARREDKMVHKAQGPMGTLVSKAKKKEAPPTGGRVMAGAIFPIAHGAVAGKPGHKLKAVGYEAGGTALGGPVGAGIGTWAAHDAGHYKKQKVRKGADADAAKLLKDGLKFKPITPKKMTGPGSMRSQMDPSTSHRAAAANRTIGKAAQPKKPSAGRVAAGAAFGPWHGVVAGKPGRKLGAAGSEVGHTLVGGAIGGTLTAVATRGRSLGALKVGQGIGQIAGAGRGVYANQRKGRLKPEPRRR